MKSGISMCYTSKEGHYFTVCTDIYNSRNIYEIEDLHINLFFFTIFLIVHISTNIVLKKMLNLVWL